MTLQAAADFFGGRIAVLSSFEKVGPCTCGAHLALPYTLVPAPPRLPSSAFPPLSCCPPCHPPQDYLIEVEPRERRSSRVLWLSFWAEVRGAAVHAAAAC